MHARLDAYWTAREHRRKALARADYSRMVSIEEKTRPFASIREGLGQHRRRIGKEQAKSRASGTLPGD